MSLVTVEPELLTAAAVGLETIGTELHTVNAGIAAPTTGVIPAAADDVSALAAARFAAHGEQYQAVAAQAAAIHEQFVAMLQASAGSYALAEATNQALAA
ncbi:PE family protein [Mycobacterium koreense]|uniref:PE family protein n=1 Tax=Mycolicibacillus koreensis TaxID=1069220 RepID=A0A7I7S843_9MYCO|nr:PE family protein [Mycolicibacillus koreensis]MCV7247883.1 PE family protein [Mycolicibacillus koreensis]ODR04614.1 PE family protein [Mycolicibacillus koreensis]OSC26790.1 PE family protein [Mycolicibacillus koreensis]BBY52978.1 PE family protein [Mycolicibacillus koreensis]